MNFAEADLFTELVKQLPSAVAIIVVVFAFLKHISDGDKRKEEIDKSRIATHEKTSDKLVASLDVNTAAIAKNSVALERCERAFTGGESK